MTAFDQAFALLKHGPVFYGYTPNKWGFLCTNCQLPLMSIAEAKRSNGTLRSEARSFGPIDELGFCPSCGGFVNPSDARSINASEYAGPYENLEAAIDAWQKEQLSRSFGAKLGREVSRLALADKIERSKLGLKPVHETNWDEDFDEEGRFTDTWRKRYRKEREEHRNLMRYRALQNRLNEEKVEEDEEEPVEEEKPVEDFSIYDNLDYDIWRRD